MTSTRLAWQGISESVGFLSVLTKESEGELIFRGVPADRKGGKSEKRSRSDAISLKQ